MDSRPGRQSRRQAIAQGFLISSAVVGGIIGAGHALMEDVNVTLPRGLLFAGALAVLVFGFAASIAYWRNIDEAAREAHKFAWFWGGSGALIILPVGLLVTSERLVAVMGRHTPAEWVLFGMAALLCAQIVGYLLVWAAWWLRQR